MRVSRVTWLSRLRRSLERRGLQLRRAPSDGEALLLGRWQLRRGAEVLRAHVDPVVLARTEGALEPHEVADE
jgi:ActR/RegA family two-component response regulator